MARLFERARRLAAVKHISGRVLDIGCGDNRLVRSYGDGVGVDIYQWGDVDLVVEDSSKLPFPDASFDTVTFVASLNHISNREEVLREAFRLLRPGGRVVATMIPPTISLIWHLVWRPFAPDEKDPRREGEVWGIAPADMIRLLEEAGLVGVQRLPFQLGINAVYVGVKPR